MDRSDKPLSLLASTEHVTRVSGHGSEPEGGEGPGVHRFRPRVDPLRDAWPSAPAFSSGVAPRSPGGADRSLGGLDSRNFELPQDRRRSPETSSSLGIAILGAWFAGTRQIEALARVMPAALGTQVLLLPADLLYGIPIWGYLSTVPFPRRLAATLVFPNSLGVFAVVVLAFGLAFGGSKRWSAFAWVAAAILVLAAGSGTGVVGLFILSGVLVLRRVEGPRRWKAAVLLLLLGAGLTMTLPTVLGRRDISESLLTEDGRLGRLVNALDGPPTLTIVMGHGLGWGSNTAASASAFGWQGVGAQSLDERQPADSTLVALVRQVGLLGSAAFYLMLATAWRQDRPLRPFYLVLAVVSLTINVLELFPVNFYGFGAGTHGRAAT